MAVRSVMRVGMVVRSLVVTVTARTLIVVSAATIALVVISMIR
ncbi:MAG TPA: hypothetical protein VF499_15780 [Afipia sp.]